VTALGRVTHIGRHLEHARREPTNADRGFGFVELRRRACRDRHTGRALGRREGRKLDTKTRADAGHDHDLVVEQHDRRAIVADGEWSKCTVTRLGETHGKHAQLQKAAGTPFPREPKLR
jgi:hypothetical protein